MTMLSYSRIREVLASILADGHSHGYRTSVAIDSDDCWLSAWATDDLYVLVQAAPSNAAGRTLIDVHAGGAYAAQRHGDLFEALSTATWRFDFGGPWARVTPDGSVAYGWRTRLPSEIVCEANLSEAFGFILGMVDAFGHAATTLASELIPRHGGQLCRDHDAGAWRALLSGLLPPQ